jgi:N-acetylglucosaminyldiphosphoundecaprenol N-acetyl-beta-D-mannosaminyltransferase
MIDRGARNVVGLRMCAVDYQFAVSRIIECAKANERCTVSALAVHGVMTGALDSIHRYRLNHLDLVVPDGHPVRWALNLLHGAKLRDVVFGPRLTYLVCEEAARQGVPVYFYGSVEDTLEKLRANLLQRFPSLIIAGSEPSRFRNLTEEEQQDAAERIRNSKARVLFVGLGCPRQEVFAYEMGNLLPMPILAVGAAFDYHAGLLKDSPRFLERMGLRWLHRLVQEPRRLWRRYLVTNTQFVLLFCAQWLHLWKPDLQRVMKPSTDIRFG